VTIWPPAAQTDEQTNRQTDRHAENGNICASLMSPHRLGALANRKCEQLAINHGPTVGATSKPGAASPLGGVLVGAERALETVFGRNSAGTHLPISR